jgi:glycosyltransferase involved in cell wall biosynthesis
MSNSVQKLSLVVPVYNEEKSIKDLVLRVDKSLSEAKIDYEIIFVNNTSILRKRPQSHK